FTGRVGGEQVVHASDALSPDQFESVECVVGGTQRGRVARHEVLPAPAVFGHQSRPFQDGDVLLYGRKAHRVSAGEGRDREALVQGPAHDVASGGVREGVEGQVHVRLFYNHTVVYI